MDAYGREEALKDFEHTLGFTYLFSLAHDTKRHLHLFLVIYFCWCHISGQLITYSLSSSIEPQSS